MVNHITVDELMLSSAVRYALGRSTYIVDVTANQVKQSWGSLTLKTQTVIFKDVEEAVNSGQKLGMEMDKQSWVNLLTFMSLNLREQ